MRSNSSFLNLNDPTFAGANATGNTPTQVSHGSTTGPVLVYIKAADMTVHLDSCHTQFWIQ